MRDVASERLPMLQVMALQSCTFWQHQVDLVTLKREHMRLGKVVEGGRKDWEENTYNSYNKFSNNKTTK